MIGAIVCAGQNNSDWYKNRNMVWRLIFEHIECSEIARKLFSLINDILKTIHARRLRQPYGNLIYRVDLKHRNLISFFRNVRDLSLLGFRTDGRADGLTRFDVV